MCSRRIAANDPQLMLVADQDPPFRMMELAIEMIQYGIFMGILSRTVKVLPYREIPKKWTSCERPWLNILTG